MKKAPNVRLSLRKLLIATMALGPLTVLPSPLWAVLPTYNPTSNSGSFTVTNGTASVTSAGTVANISTSDRAVLVWGNNTTGAPFTPDATTITNFNIQTGETYNFVLPSGGAVLNRVRAGNVTTGNATYNGVAAYIAGSLLSNGKVIVLSDSGHISVANGATINTQGGLVLSAVSESSDGPFITLGDLSYSGTPTGNITIGTATVSGNLTAVGGAVSVAPTVVGGDMILRAVTASQAISIGATAITGNLSVTTNNANISQTGAITVGSATVNTATGAVSLGNQTTTLNAGTGSVLLGNGANDFQAVTVTTSGTGDVALGDRNIIVLNNSTIGRDLTVNAAGQINTTAITNTGNLTIGGNATFNSTVSNNSAISISNVTINGTVNASTAGGTITINATGNLTTGAIASNVTANLGAAAGAATPTFGVGTIAVAAGSAGYSATTPPTVTIAAPDVAGGTQATGVAVVDATGAVTGINITNAGSGYTTAPAITIGTPAAGGTQATASSTLSTSLASIVLASGGGYGAYNSAPAVTITAAPAGGTNATATATINSTTGQITGLTLTDAGAGYTTAPTVTVAAPSVIGRNITITTTGGLTVNGAVVSSNNTSTPTISLTGGNVAFTSTGSVNNTGPAVINSTAGDIVLGAVTANRIQSRATGGSISQLAGSVLTATHTTGTSTFNATNNITLDAANVFGSTAAASAPVVQFTGGNTVSFRSINNFVLGTTNVTGNVTLLAQGAAGTNRGITIGAGLGTAEQAINIGGYLNATATGTGTITDGDYGNITVFGGLNLVTATGDIILDAASALGSLAPQVQYGIVNAASTSGNVTLSETTTLNLGNITANVLTATSTQGGVIDSGNITVTTSAAFTAGANGSVTLDNANNVLPSISFGGGFDNSITNLNSNVTIAGGTIGTGNITVGTNSGRSITLGTANVTGNLSLVSGGGIDVAGHAVVNGNLSLTSTGLLASNSFGSALTVPTSGTGAGTVTAVTSPNAAYVFSSAPTVTLTGGGTPTTAAVITPTLNANGSVSLAVTTAGAGYTSAPTISLSGGSLTSIGESTGTLVVSGNTTITATGDTNLFRGNDFTNVVLNGDGASGDRNVVINDVNDLRVSGVTLGTLTATAGGAIAAGQLAGGTTQRIANPWSLSLGNLNVGGLIATASNGGGGNSGNITQQSGTRVHSEGLTRFTVTNNTITVGNNGNNFGRVEVFTNNDGATPVTIVEDGTLRLGNLNSRGNANLTSRFGSVIEDPTADVVITNNGTLTVNAPNGSILLGNTTHTTGTTTGNLTAFAASAPNGAVAVMSLSGNANIALGNITALSLTVTSGNNVTQSGRLNIFGTTNVTAERGITLGNTTNNFGRVYLTTNNSLLGDITITEAGTLNLGSVTQAASATANFTATSVNGDIIDNGIGGVRPGGRIGAIGSGLVTLNATNGNITLNDSTTDFPTSAGVSFNANNVTLSVLGQSNLVLGSANTTSTATSLSVQSATGNITNGGPLNVSGDASFVSGAGDITLTNAANRFGTVSFSGRNVRISQANDINILTGSTATGLAEFVAGTYITIENRGGGVVSLGSTGNFTASGTIILPKLLQAAGTLTVNSPSLKDLSALSQSADLAGRSPINIGTGEYRAPQP